MSVDQTTDGGVYNEKYTWTEYEEPDWWAAAANDNLEGSEGSHEQFDPEFKVPDMDDWFEDENWAANLMEFFEFQPTNLFNVGTVALSKTAR